MEYYQFRPLSQAVSDKEPSWGTKVARVKAMLRQVPLSEDQISLALQGDMPAQHFEFIHWQNRQSILEHADFVREEIKDNLESGAIMRWNDLPESITGGRPPKVISPMSVAVRAISGKKRL